MSFVPDQADQTGSGVALGSEPLRRRESATFLVRLWKEPTSPDGTEGVVRCYLKNLKTGEEQYMGSTDALASQALAQLGVAGLSEGAPERDGSRPFPAARRGGEEQS